MFDAVAYISIGAVRGTQFIASRCVPIVPGVTKMRYRRLFLVGGQNAIVFDTYLYFVMTITEGKAQFARVDVLLYLVEGFLCDAIQQSLGITGQGALFARKDHAAR